ncbi:hypothetical protein L861_18345 [Litchfieldella anticariensis FP35 = DSM 16096]|uniref:Uncharacterized protein n=1 Tax=Litchfieldella anticariensis (strain DSM 16096 / CECT 5854 / CIP 108499 / LMG 22089 / FP35) TaxID=1121939 RepID=S2KNK8_LITA3|nr:DUF6586 family protein [Halomonas anticariensis]EPC03500.1 hypothetical protein L861_18345 [Halomonas anticariensis FP35 = DSM 16096]
MTPRGRTNQLLYQAELLLDTMAGDDEHAVSRRLASEEGALALIELALNSALRELTEHAMLERHDWRELLVEDERRLAELERLRELVRRDGSWLALLLQRIERLHGVEGAARRESSISPALITTAERLSLADELRWCVEEFKRELASMRETSFEW